MDNKGSLIVVGTGIKTAGDITVRSKEHIKNADVVYYVVPDKLSQQWLNTLNNNIIDLGSFYGSGRSRIETYNAMADAIENAVKTGKNVCAAFYGHPGVFVQASHKAIKNLREQGYSAIMEPGVSAEDCLFADIGIDPAKSGCMSIEATQFLFYQRSFDPHALLVLWQIGLAGDHTLKLTKTDNYHRGLEVLVHKLSKYYPLDHEVIIYEAATVSLFPPRIERINLSKLPQAELTAISTLVIPPYGEAGYNEELLSMMDISSADIETVLVN